MGAAMPLKKDSEFQAIRELLWVVEELLFRDALRLKVPTRLRYRKRSIKS